MNDKLTLESNAIAIDKDAPQSFNVNELKSDRKWTIAMARAALRWIDPDCPYDIWRNVISALMDNFGKDKTETYELADEWSSGTRRGVKAKKVRSRQISRSV